MKYRPGNSTRGDREGCSSRKYQESIPCEGTRVKVQLRRPNHEGNILEISELGPLLDALEKHPPHSKGRESVGVQDRNEIEQAHLNEPDTPRKRLPGCQLGIKPPRNTTLLAEGLNNGLDTPIEKNQGESTDGEREPCT